MTRKPRKSALKPRPKLKLRPAQSAGVTVRRAVRADARAIAELARELNVHQKDPTDYFTEKEVRQDGFGSRPQFQCLIAEAGGIAVGYALLLPAYETGWAACGLYVNDVHVTASARRKGVGRALMAACASEAKRQGKTFLWWASKAWNKKAQAFYKSLGAIQEPVIAHAITFGNFDKLAKEGKVRRKRAPRAS